MGPNTNDKNIMLELAKNGMDVARFNFSHGDYAEHQSRLEILKEVRKELDRPVAALLDTKGPEIRYENSRGKVSLADLTVPLTVCFLTSVFGSAVYLILS